MKNHNKQIQQKINLTPINQTYKLSLTEQKHGNLYSLRIKYSLKSKDQTN